jgi:glucose-6-phosphate 1-epimerase
MDRKNKPSALPVSPNMPQPTIDLSDNVLTARLPSGDSCVVNLYGATVTSWKTGNGAEQLFLSTAAALDGSKPIRGGIPLVFPVFGPPPKNHSTSALPQHGFARNSYWEFLGKSSSESLSKKADDTVKLDFGLSTGMLDEASQKKWPYEFGLVYSVTLGKGKLECQMHVQNKGAKAFEFQCLFHTYLQIKVSFSSRGSEPPLTSILGYLQNHSLRSRIFLIHRQSPSSQNLPRRQPTAPNQG